VEIIMNANPDFAAAVVPALDASDSRAPEATRNRDRDQARARAGVTTLETFDVYRVSLDACRACAPIAATLTATLKDQLLRASSSVVLNIAEGFGSSSRGVKRRHYEIARGSAVECIAVLDLASALGVTDESAAGLTTARTLFARIAMMLAKLEARFR
jgi:four helix bundle protein